MLAHLLPPSYKEEVVRWIKEDCPTIDVGGYVVGDVVKTASLLCKSPGVLAGVPFAAAVFEAMNVECIWMVEEGTFIDPTTSENGKFVVARIKGKCNNILLAERTALNILSRASGIASESRKAVAIKFEKKWHGHVAGTRKTTPGFKNVEKYALLVGGAATHRLDLSQMVMLKDNHIWSTGSISNAVRKAKEVAGFSAKIEVIHTAI